jgi:hypothetical protein
MGKVRENAATYSVRRLGLLRQTQRRLEKLPTKKLALVSDLLQYIEQEPSDAATQELLSIPGFYEKFLAAQEEIRKGRHVDFEQIRRDV